MPFDSYIDPLTSRIRKFYPGKWSDYFSGGIADGCNQPNPRTVRYSPFNRSHHFVIQNSTIADKVEYISNGRTILDLLHPYTNPEASMDSSARDPPPRCHPRTRMRIIAKLISWLDDLERDQDMLWLYGPAGTGKSAIAQSFAETCFEMGRLGATFFFSRPNSRDRPETVIPSLAYQLCVNCPAYKSLITSTLASHPQLLQKAIGVQFKHFIVDPLTRLQSEGHMIARQPLLILLDGLDECAGAPTQCQFIRLISENIRLRRHFPVLWLICSRPEPHLKHALSRIPQCGHEELLLDQESLDDVDLFLRDEFATIRDENPYTATPDWPPKAQFDLIARMCSGHFQVATVAVNYIKDPIIQDPVKQLNILVAYLAGAEETGIKNPLAALDLIYTRILSEIPEEILPTTQQIFAYILFFSLPSQSYTPSAQVLCNIIQLKQNEFYGALSRLHSVLRVPSPEGARHGTLGFYHMSFQDFLQDPNRSGKFTINYGWAFETVVKAYLNWYQVIVAPPHATDGGSICIPGLTWDSRYGSDSPPISKELEDQVAISIWRIFNGGMWHKSDKVLAQLRDFDFRYIRGYFAIWYLVNWIHKHYPSDTILRTEPYEDVDSQLLELLKLMTNNTPDIKGTSLPAEWIFSLLSGHRFKEFFFIGRGQKTALVLVTVGFEDTRVDILTVDNPPSEERISEYQEWHNRSWDLEIK